MMIKFNSVMHEAKCVIKKVFCLRKKVHYVVNSMKSVGFATYAKIQDVFL